MMTLEELISTREAVWLYVKRWDHDILIPTAVHKLNYSEFGELYSITFYGYTQIVSGYGKYWWCYDKRPKGAD